MTNGRKRPNEPVKRKAATGGGGRNALAALPLAIAMLGGTALPTSSGSHASAPPSAGGHAMTVADAAPEICEEVVDSDDCHSRYPAGCNANGKYDAALSFLKNRTDFPVVASAPLLRRADFAKLEARIPDGLRTNNHGAFLDQLKAVGEQQQHVVVGYLYPSKTEGAESSNCKLEGEEEEVDFHLYVGFDSEIARQLREKKTFKGDAKKALNREAVIVEMTPHFREQFEPDWTFANVKALIGRQVKVAGQLLLDNEHNIRTQNCGLPDADETKCWRASAWELHPVTQFWVCPTDACDINGNEWISVERANNK